MRSFRRIIIASNNAHKIHEIKTILKEFPYEVLSLKEAGIDVEIEENGKTFEENAYIKAKAILDLTGEAALADDSGLEVDALGGEPGVYSARYSGNHGDDKANNRKLLEELKDVPEEERTARFVCSIVMLTPDGLRLNARGTVEGVIGYKEIGDNGFGYDPLFNIPELHKTFAQLSGEEKNSMSHRGNALKELRKKLKEI
jgi:XTP/dITP diphosphohydrolase